MVNVHLLISFGKPISVQEFCAKESPHGQGEYQLTAKLQEEMQSELSALINARL
jgi:hypothetical protein